MNKKQISGLLLLLIVGVVSACNASTPEMVMEQEAPVDAVVAAEAEGVDEMVVAHGDGSRIDEVETTAGSFSNKATVADEVMVESVESDKEALMAEDDPAGETIMEQDSLTSETMTEEEAVIEAGLTEKETAMTEVVMEEVATNEAMVGEVEVAKEIVMEKSDTADATMAEPEEAVVVGPDWIMTELTNVNNGETFRVADFRGKVVLIEPMAVWCPKCTRQQEHVRTLHELVGDRDDLVSISLDIDPNENADILKLHAARNGFDWRFAVASPEVAREIAQLYGPQLLNPPATPILLVDRQGEVHLLPFGVKSAGQLQEAVTPFLNEG